MLYSLLRLIRSENYREEIRRVIMKDLNYAGDLTSIEFKEIITQKTGVMVIFGSCEQHGYHMPLDTDNILGFELGKRIAKNTNLLVLPPINYGQVWSAKDMPGSISLSESTLKMLIRDIIISLQQYSPKNIVLFSGHNGNNPVFKTSARELRDEFDWTNIWYFPMQFSKEILELQESEPSPIAIHAGELETSMIMALRPELVDKKKASNEYPKDIEEYEFRPVKWHEIITSGSFGDTSLANSQKGHKILDIIVEETSILINQLLN